MNARTLVLTPWYLPYRIVSWQEAVTMLYLDKVEMIISYNEQIRSPSCSIAMPAVIRMHKKTTTNRYRIRFSRLNVFLRDDFKCMYCGHSYSTRELTLDHVVPRSQGGRTDWENILSACAKCNTTKGGRTPVQAGMKPLRLPYKPKSLPMRQPRIDQTHIPEEWREFCTQQSMVLPRGTVALQQSHG
jgi:5-methylcytosine-specific restriction endonuclease McrA